MAEPIVRATELDAGWLAEIKRLVAPKLTDAELRLFGMVCQRVRLDPFAKQIYAIVRKDKYEGEKMTIQTAIDGFRVIAERSGKYSGQDGPFWCGQDGVWKDVWLEKEPPHAARVAVRRLDFETPLWGTALFRSYNARQNLWLVMPEHQIAKVAEALALRRAFPNDLGGIYTPEEMDRADSPHGPSAELTRGAGRAAQAAKQAQTAAEAAAVQTIQTVLTPASPLDFVIRAGNRAGRTLRELPMGELIHFARNARDPKLKEAAEQAHTIRLEQEALEAGADPATGEIVPTASDAWGEEMSHGSV